MSQDTWPNGSHADFADLATRRDALRHAAAMPGAAAMSIERVTGASGVEAWLVEDHSIPIVTLSFAFPGGAALDPAGTTA